MSLRSPHCLSVEAVLGLDQVLESQLPKMFQRHYRRLRAQTGMSEDNWPARQEVSS